MAEKRSALIVATSEYEDARLAPLGGPVEDAEALQGVLGSTEIGSFDVQLALNAPHTDLRTTLEAFFSDRGRDDLLLVHFSGHGLKDDDGLLYLAARDTRIDRLMSTGVEAGWVNRLMTRCRSEKIALFLDCCFGGAFTTGLARRAGVDTAGVKETFTGTGRFVITASDAMQYSFESGERVEGAEPQPSPFTSALVEGLRTGEADRNEDGFVSINELYDYLEDRVRQLSPAQTPTKSAFNQIGDWVIAQSLRAPTIRILPATVQAHLKSDAAIDRMAAVIDLRDLLEAADPRVGEAAIKALEKLTGDDSKAVAAAAARLIGEFPARSKPGVATEPTRVVEAELPFKTIPASDLSPEARTALSAMAATATTPPTTPPPADPSEATTAKPAGPETGHVKPTLESAVRKDPRMQAAAAQLSAQGAAKVAPAEPGKATPQTTAGEAQSAPPLSPITPAPTVPGPRPTPSQAQVAGPSGWQPPSEQPKPGALWGPNASPHGTAATPSASAFPIAQAPIPPLPVAAQGPTRPSEKVRARPGRAAARAAVGSVAAMFLQAFWIAAEDSWLAGDLEFLGDLGTLVIVFFIGATIAAALVEAFVPALRVPGGSAYRIVGGNRFLAAGLLGGILGLTVGVVAEVVAFDYKFGYNTGMSWAIILCTAIGFMLAEVVVGRGHEATTSPPT